MAVRPSKKEITEHSHFIQRRQETFSANERVKQLKNSGHSCLSCQYFPVAYDNARSDIKYCQHPKKKKLKVAIRHYNICDLHTEPKWMIENHGNLGTRTNLEKAGKEE